MKNKGRWNRVLPSLARTGIAASLAFVFLSLSASLHAEGRRELPGHVPKILATLKPLGNLPADKNLRLALGLPLRNQAALNKFLREVYDPASTNYHRYLTPRQYADKFGPAQTNYQAVLEFAAANGLKVVGQYQNRALIDVSGSVANIDKAFHITLRTYQHPTEPRQFYAPDVEPSIPDNVPILDVSGLDNYILPHPALDRTRIFQDHN